jgi:hypothetical protein
VHLTAEDAPEQPARCARLKDLSIVLVKPDDDRAERIIKGLIFQSGRPILLCPKELAARLPGSFDRVIVAWGFSMPAARAVGDSLPVLRRARDVQVVTATDANAPAEQQSGVAVIRHLAEHIINATFEMVRIGGGSIGKVLEAEVKARGAESLGDGGLRSFPVERMGQGRRDQDYHRTATLLGDDVALKRRPGRASLVGSVRRRAWLTCRRPDFLS